VNGLASLKDCPAGPASQIFPVRTLSCIANFSSSVYHYLALLISSSIFTLEFSPGDDMVFVGNTFQKGKKKRVRDIVL
jgi:hypothetical protein